MAKVSPKTVDEGIRRYRPWSISLLEQSYRYKTIRTSVATRTTCRPGAGTKIGKSAKNSRIDAKASVMALWSPCQIRSIDAMDLIGAKAETAILSIGFADTRSYLDGRISVGVDASGLCCRHRESEVNHQ